MRKVPTMRSAVLRSRLRHQMVLGLAVVAAGLLVGLLVMAGSQAVFSSPTGNAGNSLSAGTVDLVDDDSGSVMFNVSNMMPGDSSVNCITVTYQGTAANPAPVRLYSGGYTDSGDFGNHVNITVEEGTGGGFGDCTGFVSENVIEPKGTLSAFDTTHTNYATGAGVWDPAATPESKTYRFELELDASAPDSEQGESVTALTFTWEVQS